jgi:TolB-like protein/DNA-binding SARP family transcriptional activator
VRLRVAGAEFPSITARLRLIGEFRLTNARGEPVPIVSRRARGILAYLALIPEHAATRERLCGLLWSDRGESQARASLRQCLVELKETATVAELDLLSIERTHVALVQGRHDSDVAELERALVHADAEPLRRLLASAGATPLLEDLEFGGLYRDWREQTRVRLDQAIASGVVAHLSRLQAAGSWGKVRELADAYLRRDPFDEAVTAAAVRAEIALGAGAAAHRRFQALEAGLKAEFGVTPGRAAREALAGPAAAPAPLEAAASPPPDPLSPPTFAQLVAVMAFDNLSPDRDMDFFSEGISEEILTRLTRTTDLKLVGRGSSFALRGADKASPRVRAQLGATHVLDGSVRRSGEHVRVSAHLTECVSHTVMWSNRFDRNLTDVFALQDEIAESVAAAMRAAFAPAPRKARLDPETLDLWFRARQRSPRRLYFDATLLEEVIRRAPDFADAWSALASTYAVEAAWGAGSSSFGELHDRVTRTSATALALDPEIKGFEALQDALFYPVCGAYREVERRLTRALAVAPSDPRLMLAFSARLNAVGRNRLACRYAAEAYALDPLTPLNAANHAALLAKAGLRAEADAAFDRHLLRWPEDGILKTFAISHAADFEDWERVDRIARGGAPTRAYDAAIESLVEESRRRRRWTAADTAERLAELRGVVGAGGRPPLRDLGWLSAQGAVDDCYALLDMTSLDPLFEPGGQFGGADAGPVWFDPGWRLMRADRRFVGFCQRLKLAEYWLEADAGWPDCVEDLEALYDFKAAVLASSPPRPRPRSDDHSAPSPASPTTVQPLPL